MAIARQAVKGLPEGWGEQAANALADLYTQAAKLVAEITDQRLLRDRRILTAEARRARALLIEVEQILQQLDADTAAWISSIIPKGYRTGLARANTGLSEIGLRVGSVPFDLQFHGNAIDLLMLDTQDRLLEVTDGMLKRYRLTLRRLQTSDVLNQKISETLATNRIAGQTIDQTARAIKKQILAEYSDTPFTINGKQWDAGTYARLVARTKSLEAASKATVNRMVETGNDLVMVTAHGAEDGCGVYEGRVFSISGTSDTYPPLNDLPNGGPPFHPNCRHNLAPYVDKFASGSERRRAKELDISLLGKPYREVEKMVKNAQARN